MVSLFSCSKQQLMSIIACGTGKCLNFQWSALWTCYSMLAFTCLERFRAPRWNSDVEQWDGHTGTKILFLKHFNELKTNSSALGMGFCFCLGFCFCYIIRQVPSLNGKTHLIEKILWKIVYIDSHQWEKYALDWKRGGLILRVAKDLVVHRAREEQEDE